MASTINARRGRGGRGAAAFLALGLLPWPAPAGAHDLQYAVERGAAVVVRLSYGDHAALAYQSYEVLRVGDEEPFQVGRTDALGRLAFLPDRAGDWRVKVASVDGHGVDFTLTAGADAMVTAGARPFFDRHARLLAGAGLLFGVFGLWSLFLRRRR